MQRRSRIVLLAILTLSLTQEWASAQWAVIDAADVAQNTTTALNSVKQVYNSGQQLIAEYNIFRSTVTQIENQVKNLQHIPKGQPC
jgi:P-type conjugative transfer protein TrbJ